MNSKKQKNMAVKIWVIIVIICILTAVVGWWTYQNYLKGYDYNTFHYEVKLTADATNQYVVYLPVPMAYRKPTVLMDELVTIQGNATYEVGETTYGFALKIFFNGNAIIRAHKELNNPDDEAYRDYGFGELSMYAGKEAKGQYWVYFNSSKGGNVSIDFSCYNKREHSWGGSNFEWGIQNYVLKDGWQTVDIAVEGVIADG